MPSETINKILEEDRKALDILKSPDLLSHIFREVRKNVVSNTDTILALINKISIRLVMNAHPTSSNVLVTDLSGAGKDHIVKSLCDILVPNRYYHHLTDASEKILNYWKISEKDGGTFDGMVLHFEDLSEDRIKCQAFKVRASGENEIRVVDKAEMKHITIVGKPVLILTSLKANIDIEGIRRWDKVNVDTSDEVTKQVKYLYAQKMMRNPKYEEDSLIRLAFKKHLYRVSVKIPYADKILNDLPNTLTMRTQTQKLFDYIKASAALFQHQRIKDEDGFIIANEFDYAYGKFCFDYLEDVLGLATNKLEELIINAIAESGEYGMKVSDILNKVPISKTSLYGRNGEEGYLGNMKEKGILSEYSIYDDDTRRDITYWTFTKDFATVKLNRYKEGDHWKIQQTSLDSEKNQQIAKLPKGVKKFINIPVDEELKSWLSLFLGEREKLDKIVC